MPSPAKCLACCGRKSAPATIAASGDCASSTATRVATFLLDDPDDMRASIGQATLYRGRPVEEYVRDYSREPIPEAPEYALPAPEEFIPTHPRTAFRKSRSRPIDPVQPRSDRAAAAADGGDAAGPAVTFAGGQKLPHCRCCSIAGRVARRHRRAFRLECRQGARRLQRHHRRQSALDRYGSASRKALAETGGDAVASYTITAEDAAGPLSPRCRQTIGARPQLDRLGFTSVAEMLAERFHMDEDYLKALNPGGGVRPSRHFDQGRQYRLRTSRLR